MNLAIHGFAAGAIALFSGIAHASQTDLTDLSIDQLMQVEVTSASKKQQKLTEIAAAVFVLSSDDIRRSGATTLPELLMKIPGVEGGAINSHTQAVGIRGLGGQWSNKLQVLVDGGSVYTRTFSGVYWDSWNLPFEDIERIEVIRGPNTALWGSNAVNGVINIITKAASATQGTLLRASAGVDGDGDLLARQGFQLGATGYARVYASGESHSDSQLHAGGDANDNWDSHRAGVRADWDLEGGRRLNLIGDAYHIETHSDLLGPNTPLAMVPISSSLSSSGQSSGHTMLARYTHAYAVTSEWSAQIFWDHYRRNEIIDIHEDSLDLDLQQRLQPLVGHDLVWGLTVRHRSDETISDSGISLAPDDASDTHSSLFFQDEISLAADAVHVSIGSRFEHDENNGWEVQPSLRTLWNINDDHKLWGAVTRAARTPSRVDRDAAITIPWSVENPPFGRVPATIQLYGIPDFKTETMIGWELGYRLRANATTSFDLTLYRNKYEDLRSISFDVQLTPSGLLVDVPLGNAMAATIEGAELTVNWTPADAVRLQGFWAEQRVEMSRQGDDLSMDFASSYEGSSPRRQIGLRADWDIDARWTLGVDLKYVDELRQPFNDLLLGDQTIPGYVDADSRLAFKATPDIEIALIGKNLCNDSQLEYSSETGAVATEMRRTAYLRVTWMF